MRLLFLRSEAEIRVARDVFLLASAACRGVPATRAGGPSAAKNKRRWAPFRVPSFVLVAQRRRRLRDLPAGIPRIVAPGWAARYTPVVHSPRAGLCNFVRLVRRAGVRGRTRRGKAPQGSARGTPATPAEPGSQSQPLFHSPREIDVLYSGRSAHKMAKV